MASLPLNTTEEQRLKHLRALGRRYWAPYPRSFDDLRINPYWEKYDPHVAYRAFTQLILADDKVCDVLPEKEAKHQTILRLLYGWRKAYLDPEDPVCDHCAAWSIRGQRGRDEGRPAYSCEDGKRICDTSGNGTCKPCYDKGVACETMGVPAESQAVKDYVRGRQWWWFEGVGKVHCDGCRDADDCDVWEDDGCTACHIEGLHCTIRGHLPGSYEERMSRRGGFENYVCQVKREVPDRMPDLRYLYFVASGLAEAPADIPRELTPVCKTPAADSMLSPGVRNYANISMARNALLQAGVTVEPVPAKHGVFFTFYAGCVRCARFRHDCVRGSSDGPESSCIRCVSHGVDCVRRAVPAQDEASRFSIRVEVGHWNPQHARNGRFIGDLEQSLEDDVEMEDVFHDALSTH